MESTDFITEFVEDILRSAGMTSDAPRFKELAAALEERVAARMFLEMVAALPEDEAGRVRREIEAGKDDPREIVAFLRDSIPDFPMRVAQIFVVMRDDLLKDLASAQA